ncbi:MAG: hypothetical protein U1F60_15270 [Planctomycetota bacterium]
MKPAALVFALLTALPACIAQQPSSAVPKDPFRLPAGEVKIPALIDQCAAYLGANILWTAQELQGPGDMPSVKLQHPIETYRDGCEELLATLLVRSGFALVWLDEKGSMMEVVNMNGARGREVWMRAQERTVEAVLARPNLKMPVTVMMPLEHINAPIATNALRPFFASVGPVSPSLTIGNVGNNRAMLISGMQDQVVQAIRLLQKCDIPGGTDMPGMPVAVDGERVQRLEQRVKALEDQLAKAKPSEPKVGETKPASGDSKPK